MAGEEFDPQKIEEFIERIRKSQGSWKFAAGIIGVIFFLIIAFSTVYTVQPEEVGIVQRFGKYLTTTQPGLHFKLPWGIDHISKVKTQFVYKEEFGFATKSAGVRSSYSRGQNRKSVALMLTGDLNIADVEWAVQYRIQDPVKFLFNVRSPVQTLRDASEAAMRLIVGDRSVDEVLTVGREEINAETQIRLQEIMDSYDTGIKIVTVELQDVNPPDPVKESFDDVNKAKQEKETMINKAREAYNKVIPKAKGQAEQTISNAEGYAAKRINEAKGDGDRFIDVHRAYAASPSVTRRQLYNEKMKALFERLDKVWIVDDKLKNLIPLLQMTPSVASPNSGAQQ